MENEVKTPLPAENKTVNSPAENTESNSVLPSTSASSKFGLLEVTFIIIAIIGIIGFFYLGSRQERYEKTLSEEPKVLYSHEVAKEDSSNETPPGYKYLADSSFSSWTATVKGILVEKNQSDFVLSPISETRTKDGKVVIKKVEDAKPVRIIISTEKPTFYFLGKNQDITKPIPTMEYEQLPLNSTVRGGVSISYVDNEIMLIGKSFTASEQ